MKLTSIVKIMTAFALLVMTGACDIESTLNNGSTGGNTTEDNGGSSSNTNNGVGSSGDNSPITVSTKGDLNIDLDNSELVGKEASVSFSHFPNTLGQFEAVLPTLKETPQGAVVAQLMAMELYRRNRTDGEKAFYLCNVQSNVSSIMSRVPDLFGYTGTSNGGDGYARPYQVASFCRVQPRQTATLPLNLIPLMLRSA